MTDSGSENFRRLQEAVLCKKPIFKEILEKYGTRTLYDHAKYYVVDSAPVDATRSEEFVVTVGAEVERLLGSQRSHSVMQQLRKYYFVSTADHHGPICHPFFINANLLTALPFAELKDSQLENVIVLACGSISLNNSSFPRGLLFNSVSSSGIFQNYRLPFFSAHSRMRPVFNLPPYSRTEITKTKHIAHSYAVSGEISYEMEHEIARVLDEVYLAEDVLKANNYSDQITKTNYTLWKKFFKLPKKPLADLVYIEFETVVNTLIARHHVDNDTIIHRLLFDASVAPYIQTFFEGLEGAFSEKEKRGTYFFWALPPGSKYRVPLVRRGNCLETADKEYSLPLTPAALRLALDRRELIPGVMLSYLVVSLYYGVKCLGGFSQVNYLTFLKDAYVQLLGALHMDDEIGFCAQVKTKELGADMNIAFLSNSRGATVPATGLDLIVHGHQHMAEILLKQSKQINLFESFGPTMPELYRIIYPQNERDSTLMEVTSEQISTMSGIEKKILPCAETSSRVIDYELFWPGGNTTGLVYSTHQRDQHASVAKTIMSLNTEVEQVGFIEPARNEGSAFYLQMMGGEFCANGARAAAYYWHKSRGLKEVLFEASGTAALLKAVVDEEIVKIFLPPISYQNLYHHGDGIIVDLEGIRHILVFSNSFLQLQKEIIETHKNNYSAVGIVLVEFDTFGLKIDPYVWVRDTQTLVHETACASASLAAAIWYCKEHTKTSEVSIVQPSHERYTVHVERATDHFTNIYLEGIVESL